jgi:toxin ParE1/3/4
LVNFLRWAIRAGSRGTLEWVIPGLPYILVYQILEDEDLVIVAAVFHGAQNRDDE